MTCHAMVFETKKRFCGNAQSTFQSVSIYCEGSSTTAVEEYWIPKNFKDIDDNAMLKQNFIKKFLESEVQMRPTIQNLDYSNVSHCPNQVRNLRDIDG